MKSIAILLSFVVCAAFAGQHDQHHHAVDSRGDKVMGFSHEATTHHFKLYKDGGAIQVTVNDPSDHESLAAIRSHLQAVAKAFGSGDLSMPMMVHNTNIPGLETMKKLHAKISYKYDEIALGGSVRIRSTDPAAVSAVHSFLGLQIHDHRTGDSARVDAHASMNHADCPLVKSGKCPLLQSGKG
jgi:hypothetical protein